MFAAVQLSLYYFDVAAFLKMACAGDTSLDSKYDRHMAVSILFINGKHTRGYINFGKIPMALQPQCSGTKTASILVIF
jgi:hypothetical protein